MAFQSGSQIRPELGNADYSGFANAASIRAQAMMNLGEQIGGAITKYQINKQKKDDKDSLYKAILPYATQYTGSAEEADSVAKAFSKDPKIGAQILEFAGLQKDTQALNQAVAVNTDTGGKVNYDNVVTSYIELGGRDPKIAASLVEEAQGKPDFEGRVYTVNGVTFAQTSKGGAQVIDTGAKTDEQRTAAMRDFDFLVDKINQAREAYSSGDKDKANDIIAAANIQRYGTTVTADEYFGSSSTSTNQSNTGATQRTDSLQLGL